MQSREREVAQLPIQVVLMTMSTRKANEFMVFTAQCLSLNCSPFQS